MNEITIENQIKKFRSKKIAGRYNALRNDGEYVGSRNLGAYFIHLFSYESFYVEIWVLLGLNKIHWIEVQRNQAIINEYSEKVDISDLF